MRQYAKLILLTGVAALLLPVMVMAAGARICFEAESAGTVEKPMIAKSDKQVSGGKYLIIPEKAGNPPAVGGRAVYRFNVAQPGEYIFWGRVMWYDGCGNSFTIALDGGKEYAFGQDGTYRRWHWVRGISFNLAKGSHTLVISNREDGAAIDQIFLGGDRKYVPSGIEKNTQ